MFDKLKQTNLKSLLPVKICVLVGCVLAAHGAGIVGTWQFDDRSVVIGNELVTEGPIWRAMLRNRGLAFASLRLNYLLGEDSTLGYHIVNMAIHLVAAFGLWGVLHILVQKTMKMKRLAATLSTSRL